MAQSFLLNGLLAYIVLVFGLLGLQQLITALVFFYLCFAILAVWEVWAVTGIVRRALRFYREPHPAFGRPAARRAIAVTVIVIAAALVIGTLSDVRLLFK